MGPASPTAGTPPSPGSASVLAASDGAVAVASSGSGGDLLRMALSCSKSARLRAATSPSCLSTSPSCRPGAAATRTLNLLNRQNLRSGTGFHVERDPFEAAGHLGFTWNVTPATGPVGPSSPATCGAPNPEGGQK